MNGGDGFNVYEKCETMTEYNARCEAKKECDLCEKTAVKSIKVSGTESSFCKDCYNCVDGGPVLPDGWPKQKCCECENDATRATDGGMAGRMHWCSDCFEAGEMPIYLIVKDMQVGDLTGTYYQTYGGGPEGGIYRTKDAWYDIDRGWYKPWKLVQLESHVIHFNREYEMGEEDTPITIRVTYIP